jgi:uncharacterized protein YggL (DUF469 family)
MNRRLRKKKRLGEFATYGFRVFMNCDPSISSEDLDALEQRWFDELCQPHGFEHCGVAWLFGRYESFVCRSRSSATESDRDAVTQWLGEQKEIKEHEVGPLIDAWHDPVFSDPGTLIDPDYGPFLWLTMADIDRTTSIQMVRSWFLGCMAHYGDPSTWEEQKSERLSRGLPKRG